MNMPTSPSVRTTQHKKNQTEKNFERAYGAFLAKTTGGISPYSIGSLWGKWWLNLQKSPERQNELIQRGVENWLAVASNANKFEPPRHDHRFESAAWSQYPYSLYKQAFLALQDYCKVATDKVPAMSQRNTDRLQFEMRQLLDLFSPSNHPALNPEIINKTIAEKGVNLPSGAMKFFDDFAHTLLQDKQPIPEEFAIGEHLACTPGKVVFRNELFELLQYSATTPSVNSEPILFVPAWIMKYYVLDLRPENSMVRYLVSQGFTVFMISWVNPQANQAHLSLNDYRVKGVMTAIDEIRKIIPDKKIHANGYCLGGTLLAIAAATMSRDGDDRLAGVTLMAAQVDFAQAGELLLFIDDEQVSAVEDLMWSQGYLDRPQMARTFSIIRSEDRIYARAIRRYFLNEDDLPSDMTVWNNDTTRMPAQMHSDYLRSLFLENRLSAGRFAVDGSVIALKDIRVPLFVVGTESDHIAPWESVYKIRLFTDDSLTFVLTSGGHNSGIICAPGSKGSAQKAHYRMSHRHADALYVSPEQWIKSVRTTSGSWWPALVQWLTEHSSGKTSPPPMGLQKNNEHQCEDAPGRYILQT